MGCGSGTPCIDPIFGPTAADAYFSASTFSATPNLAWYVHFFNALVGNPGSDKAAAREVEPSLPYLRKLKARHGVLGVLGDHDFDGKTRHPITGLCPSLADAGIRLLRNSAVELPGVLIIRPNGGLFFGNVDRIRKQILTLVKEHSATPPDRVLLVLSASFRLSLPVLDSLELLNKQLREAGPELWLIGVPSSARAELARAELFAQLGEGRVVRTIEQGLPMSGGPGH